MAAMDIFGVHLIFLLIEHQMTCVSTTMNNWSLPYILTHIEHQISAGIQLLIIPLVVSI